MRNQNLYKKAASSFLMAVTVFALGACSRPTHKLVSSFQKHSNAMLAQQASLVSQARGTVRGDSRGFWGGSGSNNYVGYGYTPDIPQDDVGGCIDQAKQYPKQFQYYYAMVGHLTQCFERMLVASANSMYGTIFPFLDHQGQAYLRYLTDFNGAGNFGSLGYGMGYEWGYNMPFGQQNDPLNMWNILGGSGFGFNGGTF